ncbi:MAG: peptide ABC transporter substrate-binding protein [bacterium]|nr:peptide ABC transporter substrate-binding protein [bacterium]
MLSYFNFRFMRRSRKLKRQLNILRIWSINYLNRHIYGAWEKLGSMRWTFISWILLIIFSFYALAGNIINLDKFYLVDGPQSGGTYIEGLVGQVKKINPILPDNSASRDVTSIVFNSLTKVDAKRQLVGDLAEKWEISKDFKTYTFHLRPNIIWHDGVAFSADDVAFTISAIQNPDTLSPLASDWSGVKYEVIDSKTIKLILPNSYPSFLNNTTIGILPKHLLESIRPSLLRFAEFNKKPIGTGPYRVESLDEQNATIVLTANDKYFGDKPYIKNLKFISYKNNQDLIDAYAKKQILGISQIESSDISNAKKLENLKIYQLSLPSYIGLFMNMKSPQLTDPEGRKALAYSINRREIIDNLLGGQATPTYYPILAGYSGFNAKAMKYQFDLEKAKSTLANASNAKDLQKKELLLVTRDDPQSLNVANMIKDQWAKIGVNVKIKSADLNNLQQTYIRPRNYDILLYGQNLGLDSDVYSFWHSSQVSDPGLNLSNYKSSNADKYLESGRLAKDPSTKANKYANFVETWSIDVPAILLYSPFYLYGVENRVSGISSNKIAEPSDRFYNIQKWYVRKTKQLKRSLD